MEEEFQGGVCGGNWWNSSRNLFCSSVINGFGWFNHNAILNTKSAPSISDDSAGTASDGGGGGSSVVLKDVPNPHHATSDGNIDLTSFTASDDWNQDFLHDRARSQENYSDILMNYQSFPLNSPSTSSLLQCLFDNQTIDYSSGPNFAMDSTEFLPSLSNISPMAKPSLPKQQIGNNFQFVNNTPVWKATAAPAGRVRSSFLPSTQPQLIPSSLSKAKPKSHKFSAKHQNVKVGNEPAFKRPRIETPSPLPTFKVRKEKLGDRVTALQQLVSPFGKTDTASVLHEAIEYIKLVHDQVAVLTAPYLNNGSPPLQRQQAGDRINDQEEPMKDLKSRGLCLVPVSSTFPVAAEATADFW